jgi:hypothetical protein
MGVIWTYPKAVKLDNTAGASPKLSKPTPAWGADEEAAVVEDEEGNEENAVIPDYFRLARLKNAVHADVRTESVDAALTRGRVGSAYFTLYFFNLNGDS